MTPYLGDQKAANSAAERLTLLRVQSPTVAQLARLLSLTVRVEPSLLRAARLAADLDAAVEADLWFSGIIASRGSLGVSLDPFVAEELRHELAELPDELTLAWRLTTQHHGDQPWSIRLEERINFLSVAPNEDPSEIQDLLAAALAELHRVRVQDERGAVGIARWLLAAIARAPSTVRATPTAGAAAVAAGLNIDGRLGGADQVAQAEKSDLLPWLLDRLGTTILPVRLLPGGVELGGDSPDGIPLSVPETNPLVLSVSWRTGPTTHREDIRLPKEGQRFVSTEAAEIELRTLSGGGVVLQRAGIGRIVVDGVDRGAGFAVGTSSVITAANVIDSSSNGPMSVQRGLSSASEVMYVPHGDKPMRAEVVAIDHTLDAALLHTDRAVPAVSPVGRPDPGQDWLLHAARGTHLSDWKPGAAPPVASFRFRRVTTSSESQPSLLLVGGADSPRGQSGAAITLESPRGAVVGMLLAETAASPAEEGKPNLGVDRQFLFAPIDSIVDRFNLASQITEAKRAGDPTGSDEVASLYPEAHVDEFVGRHRELALISRWLADPADPRPLIVTGRPGSGKTSLVRFLAAASKPAVRRELLPTRPLESIPPINSIAGIVSARSLDAVGLLDRLLALFGLAASGLGTDSDLDALLSATRQRHPTPTVVIDGLDESLNPDMLMGSTVFSRLSRAGRGQLRLLMTTRPRLGIAPLSGLGSDVITVDLDADDYAEAEIVRSVVRRILQESWANTAESRSVSSGEFDQITAMIAERANGQILLAKMFATHFATESKGNFDDLKAWLDVHQSLAAVVDSIIERSATGQVVRDRFEILLRALASVGSVGATIREWIDSAEQLTQEPFSRTDPEALLSSTAAQLITVAEGNAGNTRYQIFHSAVAEYLLSEAHKQAWARRGRHEERSSNLEMQVQRLAADYNAFRARMVPGKERTAEMTGVVTEMLSLFSTDDSSLQRDAATWIQDGDRGMRLAAYAYFQAHPDPAYADAIAAAALNEDKPFGQLWGLRAVRQNVERGERLRRENRRALEDLMNEIGSATDRGHEISAILRLTSGTESQRDRKKVDAARDRFTTAAEAGHTDAQNNLGILLSTQLDPPELDAARDRFTTAAEAGHTDAQNNLGILLSTQLDPPDLDAARHWFTTAAEAGHTDAQNNLGILLSTQLDPPDLDAARHWFTTAAEAGHTDAQNNLESLL